MPRPPARRCAMLSLSLPTGERAKRNCANCGRKSPLRSLPRKTTSIKSPRSWIVSSLFCKKLHQREALEEQGRVQSTGLRLGRAARRESALPRRSTHVEQVGIVLHGG